MPADPVLDAGSLGDEVIAMVDEQPHLARGPVELRGRKIRFAPGRARDRERVQSVGLGGSAGAAANAGHHLRRDAHDVLAGAQQVRFERARQVPAVLKRPAPVGPAPRPAIAARCPSAVAANVLAASSRPSSSDATSVCVRLCASTPITTSLSPFIPPPVAHYDRLVAAAVGRTCLSRETESGSYQVTPGRSAAPSGRHDRRTATTEPAGQHGNEPTRRTHPLTVALTHGKQYSGVAS